MRKFPSPLFPLALLLVLSLLSCQAPKTPQANGDFPDKLHILALLEKQDYDGLEQLLTGLQQATENNIAEETKTYFAFDAFATSRPGVASLLQKWVAARPSSYCAQLATGIYFLELGIDRRGGDWASKTSTEQFAQMNAAFDQAIPYLQAALSINPRLTDAYAAQITIAVFRGDDELEQALTQKGLEIAPASFNIRRIHMAALEPRWGGSYAAMEEFAEQSQIHAAAFPKLKVLRGLIAWDQGTYAFADKDYGKAAELFTQALKSGEYSFFYADRSKAYFRMASYDEALEDAEVALRLYPQTQEFLIAKAYALTALGRLDEASADLELATALNPECQCLANVTKWVAARVAYEGYELHKKGRFEDCIAQLDKAIQIDSKQPEPFYWRGHARIKLKQFEQAKGDFEEALRLNPAYFESAQNLDWLYARESRWDDVVDMWNHFLDTNPAQAGAYLERAGAWRRKGNMVAALDDLKTACDLGNQQACQYYGQRPR